MPTGGRSGTCPDLVGSSDIKHVLCVPDAFAGTSRIRAALAAEEMFWGSLIKNEREGTTA